MEAGGADEAEHPTTLAGEGGQRLEHGLVVVDGGPGEHEGDIGGQVGVAGRHGVGVAEGDEGHLGRGPGPDARESPAGAGAPPRDRGRGGPPTGNAPAGGDPLEKQTTQWYHDHRMDFTATNVYMGLTGFYLLFDNQDTGNENDTSPDAFRLPSGKYDVPMILHDISLGEDGQLYLSQDTNGFLGRYYTVNRKITPFLEVEPRKYRFRFLNGGPSRFYELGLRSDQLFTVIANDGNLLPKPVTAETIKMSVAQRFDVIVDFSQYQPGASIVLENLMEQIRGEGPTGRKFRQR